MFYRAVFFLQTSGVFESKTHMKTNQSVRQHNDAADSRPHLNHQPDFFVQGSGTMFLFVPLSQTAQAWLDTHCPADDDHQYLGCNLAIEFRYVADIIRSAIRDGLTSTAEFLAEGRVL